MKMQSELRATFERIRAHLLPDVDCPLCGCNASGRAVQQLGCCWECNEAGRAAKIKEGWEAERLECLPVHWRDAPGRITADQAAAYSMIEAWAPGKGWLYVYGPYGVGKSHLVALRAKQLAKRGSLAWVSYPEFAAMPYDEAQVVVDVTAKADVLVLDDLLGGAQKSKLVGPMLNSRLTGGQSLVVTTNLYLRRQDKRPGLAEPYELLGQYVAERLLEGVSDYVYLDGPNMRVANSTQRKFV